MELDRMLRITEVLQITGVSNAIHCRWIKGCLPIPNPALLPPLESRS